MKEPVRINTESLNSITAKCYNIYSSIESKGEALALITDFISNQLGKSFSPDILENPDEISIHFIELLDQIVFEIVENYSGNDTIREYIIDDLHARIGIFFDVFKDIDVYKQKLSKRVLFYEDSLIIKCYNLEEFIPRLIQDFYEYPNLQIFFMKTLLSFINTELLDFYTGIFTEDVSIEVKILALIGIKMFDEELYNWEQIKTDITNLNGLASYVERFDRDCLENNVPPGDIYSLFFVFSYIELNQNTISCDVIKIMSFSLESVSTNAYTDHSFITNIYNAIANIVLNYDLEELCYILENETETKSFIFLIDFLPKEFFDRIAVKLSQVGDHFIEIVTDLVNEAKIDINNGDSNVNSYMLWHANRNMGKI